MINIQSAVRGMSKYWKLYILGLYRVDQTTLPQTIQGNVNASGYITGIQCGVFAFLVLPANTRLRERDEYLPIAGTFVNAPMKMFYEGTTQKQLWPAIIYDGISQYFLIDWHCTFQASQNDSTVRFSIAIDEVVDNTSCMQSFVKYAGLMNSISGTFVVYLLKNQMITLVVSSDIEQDITFHSFTTTIRLFFD